MNFTAFAPLLPQPQSIEPARTRRRSVSPAEPTVFKCPSVWQGDRPLIDVMIRDYGHVPLDALEGTYGWCIRYTQQNKQAALGLRTLGEFLERFREGGEDPLPYLMHLSINRNLKDLRRLFETPAEFRPNWTSPACLDRVGGPELFFGQRGTGFGPIHIDHIAVHVGFYQFSGAKKFLLFPPEDGPNLYRYPGAQFPWQLRNSRVCGYDEEICRKFPNMRNTRPREITLRAGEALFMPANWWHTTFNLTDSVSYSVRIVNHTNIGKMLAELARGVPRWITRRASGTNG